MRHHITAAALAVAALALTACTAASTDTGTTADKPKAATSKPKTPEHSTPETAFLLAVRSKIPALAKAPDDQILDVGHSSCDAIDEGNSPTAVAATVEKNAQIGLTNSGYLVGAAVSQLCPQHKSEL